MLAAVNGAAVGAGMCFASAADIRVAAKDAKMGFNFVKFVFYCLFALLAHPNKTGLGSILAWRPLTFSLASFIPKLRLSSFWYKNNIRLLMCCFFFFFFFW